MKPRRLDLREPEDDPPAPSREPAAVPAGARGVAFEGRFPAPRGASRFVPIDPAGAPIGAPRPGERYRRTAGRRFNPQ